MATTVKYYSGLNPTNNVTTQYGSAAQNGAARTDVSIAISACVRNADGTFSAYITVTGSNDPKGNMTYVEGNDGLVSVLPDGSGFSLRTGWPGYTNTVSVFCVTYDAATGFPATINVQAGAKGGGGTPNTGFAFVKTKVMDEVEE